MQNKTTPKIFLLCSERSGSNFITKLFNAHSQICGPSTKHLMNPYFRNLFRYGDLKKDENWKVLVDDLLNLYNVDFSIWKSHISEQELLENVEVGNTKGLINYFFDKEVRAQKKSIAFIKEIKVHEFLPYLLNFFPNSKYVYLVRDPRDMALSWKKSPSHKGGIIAAARQWKIDQQNALKNMYLLNESQNAVSLKYEGLTANTEKELKRALNALELDYENNMLDFHKDKLTQKNAETQPAWENLSKGVMNSNFNKFEKELSSEEIRWIEYICYQEMLHLGYTLKYEIKELEKLNQKDLSIFESNELANKQYSPAPGVIENMRAKKRFYDRNLK